MCIKRILNILIILVLGFTSVAYADDIDDIEIINWSEDVVQTTNNNEEPKESNA